MKLNEYMNIIYESSLSRIWKMIEEGKYGFGIISAHRYELPVDENKKRHEDLKGEIKSKGFGFC